METFRYMVGFTSYQRNEEGRIYPAARYDTFQSVEARNWEEGAKLVFYDFNLRHPKNTQDPEVGFFIEGIFPDPLQWVKLNQKTEGISGKLINTSKKDMYKNYKELIKHNIFVVPFPIEELTGDSFAEN